MLEFGLSSQQLEVIYALSNGVALTAAAEQAGVHRNTIHNWRRNHLPFQQALADAQYGRALHFREKIEAQVDLAVKTLHDLLTDPKTPASTRLKAALAVIHLAATPPAPKQQVIVHVEKVAIDKSQPEPEPPAPQARSAAQPEPSFVHNPAQSAQPAAHNPAQSVPPKMHNTAQPIRRPDPKTGRNELCPCGSGLKIKRCWLNKPRTVTSRAAAA